MIEYPVIDVWMQPGLQKFLNEPMFDSLKRWNKNGGLSEEIPVEHTLRDMDQANIVKGLLSSWTGPAGPLIPNETIDAMVQRFPDRFYGIASVPINRPVEAVDILDHYVTHQGFKGLRIVQWLWNLPPTHAYYYPLFTRCVQLDIPVCLQVGHTGPLMPSEVGRPIPYIDQVAIDFPKLKIVCGHIGYPWTNEMIAVATKHKNVYIDTSAYTTKRYPLELVQFMKAHGRKKVLFGTNYPMISPGKCLENLADLQLPQDVSENFLYKNAERVFKIEVS